MIERILFALLAQKDCRAGGGEIERRYRRLCSRPRGDFVLDKAGIDLAADHLRMAYQRCEKVEIRGHARNLELAQGRRHALDCLPPLRAGHDQLR